MRSPTPDELAAIAAAWLQICRAAQPPAAPPASRWQLAARRAALGEAAFDAAARGRSRWRDAGRLDG